MAALSRRQYGTIHRRQAIECGLSERMIEQRIAKGIWMIEAPSVYRLAAVAPTWWTELAVAGSSTGGVASHLTGAHLWDIEGFGQGRPHMTVPDFDVRRRGVVVHRTARWDLVDPCERHGITTTGIERTVVDLARYLRPDRLSAAIDDVLRRRLSTLDDLASSAVEHSERGRKGVPVLRALIEDRQDEHGVPQSVFNRMVGDLLVRYGLPRPVFEHQIFASDRFVARVDLAYPDQRLAIECQSRRWHDNSASFDTDPARRAEITRLGWRVLEFTWAHYRHHDVWLVNTVMAHLAAAPRPVPVAFTRE